MEQQGKACIYLIRTPFLVFKVDCQFYEPRVVSEVIFIYNAKRAACVF